MVVGLRFDTFSYTFSFRILKYLIPMGNSCGGFKGVAIKIVRRLDLVVEVKVKGSCSDFLLVEIGFTRVLVPVTVSFNLETTWLVLGDGSFLTDTTLLFNEFNMLRRPFKGIEESFLVTKSFLKK